MSILLQAVALISEPPGSFVYHLVLLFALGAATAIAATQWGRTRGAPLGRLALAAGGIFLLHLIAFAVALLSAASVLDPLITLPPLTRAVSTLTILLIIWVFAFPDPLAPADAATAILSLLVLIAFGVSFVVWLPEAASAGFYNNSAQEGLWEIAQIVLLFGGLILLGLRRKSDWFIGLFLLLLLLAGHVVHYLFPLAGTNVPGAERLVEIVALPILAAMAFRRIQMPAARPPVSPQPSPEVVPQPPGPEVVPEPSPAQEAAALAVAAPLPPLPEEPSPPVPQPTPVAAQPDTQRLKWGLDPKAAVALASLNASTSPDEVGKILTLATAHLFRADLCLLITPPDASGAASVACAYDLIREKFLGGAVLPLSDMLTVDSALRRGEPAFLAPDQHSMELHRLAASVGFEQIGPSLLVPLKGEDGLPLGVIVLMSPYAQREWTEDDQTLLAQVVEPIGATLSTADKIARLNQELARAESAAQERRSDQESAESLASELRLARADASRLADQLTQMQSDAERYRQEAEGLYQQLQAREDTLARQTALQDEIAALEYEINELQAKAQLSQREAEERERIVAELDAVRREAEERQQRELGLQAELEHTRAELSALNTEQQASASQLAALQAEVDLAQPAVAARQQLEAELQQAQERLEAKAQLEAQLDAAQREVEEHRQRTPELEAALEHARTEWQAINTQLQASPSPEALDRLKAELEAAQQQAEQLKALETELQEARVHLGDQAALEAKLEATAREAEERQQRELALQAELEQARQEGSALNAQLQAAAAQAEALERLKAESEAARQRAEERDWLEAAFKESQARLEATAREAEERRQRELALQDELEQARQEGSALNAQLQTAAAQAEALERLKAELGGAQQQRDWFEAAFKESQARLEATAREAEERRQRELALQAELEQARQEGGALNAQLQTAAAQAEALERLKAESEAARQRAEERDRLEAELNETQARLEATAREAEERRQRELKLQAELERIRKDWTTFNTQVQAIAPQLESLKRLKAELGGAQQQRDRLEAAFKESQARLEATAREAEERRQRELALQAELEQARQEGGALNAQLQTAAAQAEALERLKAESEAARQRAEERDRLEAELNEARALLDAQAAAEAKLRLDLESHAQVEFQLRRELELTRTELKKLTERSAAVAAEAPEASPEDEEALAKVKAELDEKSRALATAQAALTAAQTEMADQARSVAVMRELLSKKERQLAKAKESFATASEQFKTPTEAQAQLEDRGQQLARAQEALAALQAQLAAKDQQLAEAQAAPASSAQPPSALQEQLAEKDRQLAKAQQVLTTLSAQARAAATLQEQLAEKERQLAQIQAQLAETERQWGEAQAIMQQASGAAVAAVSGPVVEGTPHLPAPPSLEVIASMTQELRQPMSSIVGYSDLLLGESVGILGALQRKFLERIIASCERMEALLDDLIRVTAIDSGRLQLARDKLDVMSVIEEALLGVGARFREKGINLRLDIADDLPPIVGDRDALREIISHLLNNAGSASAIDGEVVLTVQREFEQPLGGEPINYLFISVRDSGGGIALADQPRVFSRVYRADAPLIAGLGDTGVGLSIAKALVEAQGGRIWLTSEIGVGSTISFLIPVDDHPPKAGGNGSEPQR